MSISFYDIGSEQDNLIKIRSTLLHYVVWYTAKFMERRLGYDFNEIENNNSSVI